MAQWYLAYTGKGNIHHFISNLQDFVRVWNIGRYIRAIRIEPDIKTWEFLFYLECETEEVGILPEAITQILNEYPDLSRPYRDPSTDRLAVLSEAQIKSSSKSSISLRHEGRIPYRAFRPSVPRTLAEAIANGDEHEDSTDESSLLNQAWQHDQLLLWMSALGCGSVEQFRYTAELLGLEPKRVFQYLRGLRLLGFIRGGYKDVHWQVLPTTINKTLINGQECYLVCGARSLALLATFDLKTDLQLYAPSRICITSHTHQPIEPIIHAQGLPIIDNLAWQLAQKLPSIED